MKKDIQLYILLIFSIFCIPAAYLFVAAEFVIQIIRGNYETLKKIIYNKFLFIILIYIIIGVVFSNYLLVSSLYGVMMLLCLYTIQKTYDNMDFANIYNIKRLLYIASLIVFVIGIIQFLSPEFVIPQKWVDIGEYKLNKRIYSTFFNPNIFGFYINIVLIIIVINIRKADKLEASVFIIGIGCLFLTFSRTSWISLIITLFVSGLLFDKKYLKFALLIAIVLIGLDRILDIGRFNLTRAVEDSSILYRFEIWKACLKITKDNIITGIGFGTLFKYIASYSNKVKPNIEHCHNLYIQIVTETGIVGFSGFLLVLYNLIRYLWSNISKTKNNHQYITTCAIIMMVMIHGLVDSVFFTPQILLILSIFTGIMLNEGKEQLKTVPKHINEYQTNYSNKNKIKAG